MHDVLVPAAAVPVQPAQRGLEAREVPARVRPAAKVRVAAIQADVLVDASVLPAVHGTADACSNEQLRRLVERLRLQVTKVDQRLHHAEEWPPKAYELLIARTEPARGRIARRSQPARRKVVAVAAASVGARRVPRRRASPRRRRAARRAIEVPRRHPTPIT